MPVARALAVAFAAVLWLSAVPARGQDAPPAGEVLVTLDFQDADITEVISTIAKATGKNFLYDDSGQFDGVKLTNIRPGGAFTGMPENSVCFELNGAKLDGVQRLPQALLAMGNGQTCLKCRQPDGTETTRCL